MVSPAPKDPKAASSEEATKKAQEDEQAKEDAAFQALLNSQRDILAKLDFGNSSSELQFVEGPDNLPIVSPHNSAEFHLSYNNGDYPDFDYEYGEPPNYHHGYHHPPQPYHHSHHHSYQQHHHQGMPRDSAPSMGVGVGDDRFILDQIEIGPRSPAKGPSQFYDDRHMMRRRKRDGRQELMETPSQRSKKRRNEHMSFAQDASAYDDLLPGPTDLADLDESSSSLLLDDLDFPSLHNDTAMWKPRDRTVTEDSEVLEQERASDDFLKNMKGDEAPMKPEETKTVPTCDAKPHAEAPSVKPCVSMEEEGPTSRPPVPKRSSRNLWKPRRRRSSADVSIEERRSMWKPRRSVKRESAASSAMNDSCTSLQVEDLAGNFPEQQQPSNHVSIRDGDMMEQGKGEEPRPKRSCPARTASEDSTGSVKSLSVALQQSIGSTKTIQAWDKNMGLKRSHSKTMQLSSKSREQLLAFFKKEQEELQAMGVAVPQTDFKMAELDETAPAAEL